jgi:TPP-dependent pyruvate/acetoin dehydrogenase alpha subunit
MNNTVVTHLADKGVGYGMESHIIDGNNILEVFTKVSELVASLVRIRDRFYWNF